MNVVSAAFIHFHNVEVVVNQVTKDVDQRGLGCN